MEAHATSLVVLPAPDAIVERALALDYMTEAKFLQLAALSEMAADKTRSPRRAPPT